MKLNELNDADRYNEIQWKVGESLDFILEWTGKANLYSENILYVSNKIKTVVDYIEKPGKLISPQVQKEVKVLRDIAERIKTLEKIMLIILKKSNNSLISMIAN